ncbi:MAG: LacI family DNA-binding transcriptional regulator [bacterium]
MISLRKLADIAGVSHMTVYRALHGHARISDTTRKQIIALAEEYGYTSEPVPTSVLSYAPTIACIFPVSGFFNQLSLQFVQLGYQHGYEVLHMETPNVNEPMAPLITRLIRANVSAAFLFSPDYRPISRALIYELKSRNILPFITGRPEPLLVDTVKTDEQTLTTQVIDYLLSKGHRQIAYLGYSWAERSVSFIAGIKHRGLSLAHCKLPTVLQQKMDRSWHLPDETIEMLMSRNPAPTAIFCYDDYIAAEVLRQCYLRGVKVPQDISVIGCGNSELARYLSPRLTSVDQQVNSGVQRIWQQFLLRRDANPDDNPQPPVLLLHPSNLVVRESCRSIK